MGACVPGSVGRVRWCGASVTSQYVSVEDKRIHVVRKGSGAQPLLLLPGALGSALTDFKPQLEGLDGDKLTVIGWDPPGYGKSRPPGRSWQDFFREDARLAVGTMRALGFS